jgi:hypothetical protein
MEQAKASPDKACSGRVGFCAVYQHFSLGSPPGQAGFEFFSAPKHCPRPHATKSLLKNPLVGGDLNHTNRQNLFVGLREKAK